VTEIKHIFFSPLQLVARKRKKGAGALGREGQLYIEGKTLPLHASSMYIIRI